MKTYYCVKCDVDFEAEDKLRANKPARCPKCKKGAEVIRALNDLKHISKILR